MKPSKDPKDMPVLEIIERLMAAVKAKNQTLQSLDRSLEFVYKVVTKEREKLGPAGLDGHLNSIGGVVLQMRDWIKASLPNTPPAQRSLTPPEIAKGRSAGYWEMSSEDQWAEDKRLGILDWIYY